MCVVNVFAFFFLSWLKKKEEKKKNEYRYTSQC